MKRKYIIFLTSFLLGLSLSGIAFAEGRGALANDLVGARASVLGEAFVAVADDASALRWNPARLPLMLQPELTASHVSLFSLGGYLDYSDNSGSINQDFIGVAIPNDTIPFGISLLSLWTSVPYTDEGGAFIQPRSYNERMLSISLGKQLMSGGFGVSSGANINYLNVNGRSNYSSFGLDGGILLKTPGILPDVGIAVKGISSEIPIKLDFALSLNPIRPLRLVGGVSKVMDSHTLQYSAGFEYLLRWLSPLNISFLSGYRGLGQIGSGSLRSDARDISTGLSIRLGRYKIDYAYERHSAIADTHRITFGAFMDSLEGFYMKSARRAYNDLDDEKTIQELNELIYFSPRNAEAYHLMAFSYERMRQKAKAIEILRKIGGMDKEYYKKNNLEQLIQDINDQ